MLKNFSVKILVLHYFQKIVLKNAKNFVHLSVLKSAIVFKL